MRKIVNFCDFFVVATGSVDKHITTIAEGIIEGLKEKGQRFWHMEGDGQTKWIVLDFGDCVVHIFDKNLRGFYSLEHLWQDAPRVTFKNKPPTSS